VFLVCSWAGVGVLRGTYYWQMGAVDPCVMVSVGLYVLFSHSNVNVTGAWAKLPLLVPTLSYNFGNAVECLDTDGRTEPIKVNCGSEMR